MQSAKLDQTEFMQIKASKKCRHFNRLKVVLTAQNLNAAHKRKFVNVKMNNIEVKHQLGKDSEVTIINEKHCFRGKNVCRVSCTGKTLKTNFEKNLLSADWMELFGLWRLPVNLFCKKKSELPPPPAPKASMATESFLKAFKTEFCNSILLKSWEMCEGIFFFFT